MTDKLILERRKADNVIINVPENFKIDINIPGFSKKKNENREKEVL